MSTSHETRVGRIMSLREMGAWALIYHGILLLLLSGASLVLPWRALALLVGLAFVAWMAGGQASAWVYDPRREDRR